MWNWVRSPEISGRFGAILRMLAAGMCCRDRGYGFVWANCRLRSVARLANRDFRVARWLPFTDEQQVAEGSLLHVVEAGFVAGEECEAVVGRQIAEGRSSTRELAAFLFASHGLFDHRGFDSPGAAKAPVGGGEFLDHVEFESVHESEALNQDVAERFEGFGGLGALPSGVWGPVDLAALVRLALCRWGTATDPLRCGLPTMNRPGYRGRATALMAPAKPVSLVCRNVKMPYPGVWVNWFPDNDLWIAPLVLEHDLVLITRDRHFERIPQVMRA
jgi:hypothetical protein